MGVSPPWKASPLWMLRAPGPARTPDTEPPWQAASRISPPPCEPERWWLLSVSACVAARVCRKTECSSSRGCWTSTGACGGQSGFRCTTIMKDSASNSTTRHNRVRPELTLAPHSDHLFIVCFPCLRWSSILLSFYQMIGLWVWCYDYCHLAYVHIDRPKWQPSYFSLTGEV